MKSWNIGEYELKDGKVAVINHIQLNSKRMYVGHIRLANGELRAADWDERGMWGTEQLSIAGFDLPGAIKSHRLAGYCNIYKVEDSDAFELGPLHDTLQDSIEFSSDEAIARVRVEVFFYEGENV